eukprot:8925247-Karenia_brevis.AAC.1
MGAAVDVSSYTLRTPSSIPLPFFDMPLQHFKTCITKLGSHAVHLSSHLNRTVLCDLPRFDSNIFLSSLPKNDLHFVNTLKSIASLSSVDQSLLHRFNDSVTETCIFCQNCKSSIHHILWECSHEALVKARTTHSSNEQQHVLDVISLLPLAMKYGLTPPLALLPHSPWWTNQTVDTSHLDLSSSCKQFVGIDCSYSIDDAFCQWLLPYAKYDASDAFQLLNGAGQTLETPPPPAPITARAPDEPNCFSDGSLTHPTLPTYGLATAGVWHPCRSLDDLP